MVNDNRIVRAALAAALVILVLGGCASPQRSEEALQWVVSDEARKKQLDDDGFPQYVGGN